MNARDDILARIRAVRPTAPVTVDRDYDPPAPDGTDLTELLTDRLLDYRATVRHCDQAGLPGVLAELLRDATAVIVPPGLPPGWLAEADRPLLVDRAGTSDQAELGSHAGRGGNGALTPGDLDQAGVVVVTGCAVAIARTGTIILDAGPDQGRRLLTLVPDRHVCVVRADQIAYGVPEALARLADPTRPLTMISGPSATSDIELNRVEGVHGPRQIDVVIVA